MSLFSASAGAVEPAYVSSARIEGEMSHSLAHIRKIILASKKTPAGQKNRLAGPDVGLSIAGIPAIRVRKAALEDA